MRLTDCHNVMDFRRLAKARLPSPLFDFIDGGADDETTMARNTAAFDACDLVPNVLTGVDAVDLRTTIMGREVAMPLILSPTALQRLFHWQGERAVAQAAARHGVWFGISSMSTVSIEEISRITGAPKLFQLYAHRDQGLNRSLIDRAKAAGFDALALTVDAMVSGNRERCLRSGFRSPPRLTPRSALSFAAHPRWTLNYLLRERFALANVEGQQSLYDYVRTMLDPALDWRAAEAMRVQWGGPFCIKGIMSAEDARRAADIGATAIMVSNHGGRQLDGSRAPFDQLAEIVDAVGDRMEVILDSGVRRGSHILKALSLGAKAVGGGRLYLYALTAAGEAGVDRVLTLLEAEIRRDMHLMGKANLAALCRNNLRWRQPERTAG